MAQSNDIVIEVAYADEQQEFIRKLQVAIGTTVQQAIVQSGVLTEITQIDLLINKVGIFSQEVSLDTLLADGDRIEIYRPLKIDPKQKRKLRAKQQRQR